MSGRFWAARYALHVLFLGFRMGNPKLESLSSPTLGKKVGQFGVLIGAGDSGSATPSVNDPSSRPSPNHSP